MKLTVLGSGTAVIRKKRHSASMFVDAMGKTLLLDCGWGCPENMLKAGKNPQTIDHILISHPHPDHMGSLMNLLQSMLVSGVDVSGKGWEQRKREKTLYLHGYDGFAEDYEALRKIMFPERKEPYKIEVFEYPKNTNTFDGIKITGTTVTHVPEYFNSSAYRIDCDGKSIVYSGDCGYDERLVELSNNADLALYDVSVPPWMFKKGARPNHTSAYECGLMAHQAGVKKLALFHLYDNATKPATEKEARRGGFPNELIITKDLQTIEI
jgi:ribonuclease BN (tRNA processing enzyme)